jgi:DNA-binding transcriptional MerR regulator
MTPTSRRPSVRRRSSASKKPTTITAIPERGLKIGEAARALGVETYVLRFWETQFPFLKPKHTRTKHRFYQEKDLDVLRLIKRLLHDEGFTIVGANKHIKEFGIDALMSGKPAAKPSPASSSERAASPSSAIDGEARQVLNEVRRDLESIHKILED